MSNATPFAFYQAQGRKPIPVELFKYDPYSCRIIDGTECGELVMLEEVPGTANEPIIFDSLDGWLAISAACMWWVDNKIPVEDAQFSHASREDMTELIDRVLGEVLHQDHALEGWDDEDMYDLRDAIEEFICERANQ